MMQKLKTVALALRASRTIDQMESDRAFERFYLRRKAIQLGFALGVLALGGLCFYSFQGTWQLLTFAKAGPPVSHVVGALQKLSGQLAEAELNARAYLLTLEPQYLKLYDVSSLQAEQELTALRALSAGDPVRAGRVDQLEALSQDVLAALRHAVRLAQRQEAPAPDQAQALLDSHLLQGLQRAVHQAQDGELQRAEAPWPAARVRAQRTLILVALTSLWGAGLVGLAKWIMLHDLHQHRLTSARLRASRRYVTCLQDAVPDPLVVLDAQLRVQQVNAAFCQTFGLTATAVRHKSLLHLQGGEWNQRGLRKLLEEVLPKVPQVTDLEWECHFEQLGAQTFWLNAHWAVLPGSTRLIILTFAQAPRRAPARPLQVADATNAINNALTPILGLSELLAQDPDQWGDKPNTLHRLGAIHAAARRAAAALRQFSPLSELTPTARDARVTSALFESAPPPRRPDSPPALRILLVEDDALVRLTLQEYLTGDGHAVQVATDGQQGYDAFRVGEFDLLVTDHAMPVMNGEQLAIAVKQLKPLQPVILLTGFSDRFNGADRPLAVDVVAHKPITLDELRPAIATAMDYRRAEPEPHSLSLFAIMAARAMGSAQN